ncbi:MAG: Secretory immunoglobulin A-binding protein EsiB [Alphaproteobacteria bacterium MarineAlpha9_Bin3]|nr:MAG: Secretory immunoglobulin A-binding protein EsiB [Alphaproteobacteria bacterium MarineAlpha9_Bin3]
MIKFNFFNSFFVISFVFFLIFFSDSVISYADDEIINLETRKQELTKDAYAGDADAQYMLGRLALETKNPPDHSTAVYWFRIASESNHLKAQEMLGAQLFSGLGVPANPKEASIWWYKAAMAGSSTAQASLGVLYALGSGVKKDLIEAYKWLTIASLYGNKAAAIQRDDSISLQMTANEIREAQKRVDLIIKEIKK